MAFYIAYAARFHVVIVISDGESALYELNDWPLLGEHRFVGLDNYKDIAVDPLFWKVFGNTAYFTLGLVPFNIVLALMLALLLSKSLKGIGIFRTAIFVPVMTSLIVWAHRLEVYVRHRFRADQSALDAVQH